MHTQWTRTIFLCAVIVIGAMTALADIRVAGLFTDHLVLQQRQPVPVWGTAAPGEVVTVTFAGQMVKTVADAVGQWRVTLAPLAASAKVRDLVIAGTNTITCHDVLVGEVWLASGQSNMAMAMHSQRRGPVLDADAEITAAKWPLIRLFQSPTESERCPADNCWQPCTPESVKLFSAVAYFYARELHTTLKVPVGIINASLGGSAIASWTPPDGKLFTAWVKPLIPFAMRGMIWYQGESDPRLSYSDDQRTLVTRLRALWGIGDFPFYYTQVAPAYDFTRNQLPLLWQAQVNALAVPNSYLAATGDLGINLHPPDKRAVGKRLARIALALTYHKTREEYSAPIFASARTEGNRIRLAFTHAKGLRCSDAGPLSWFTIAGEDRVFHPADAVIDGTSVLVSTEEVPHPVAVRYAWDKLAEPNLVNAAGLPAFAFRTDDWPVSTDEPKPVRAAMTIPRYAAVTTLDAARPLLDAAPARTLARGGREYASVAWAVTGDMLLLRFRVRDALVSASLPDWHGASAEVYLSQLDGKRVRQVVFALQGPSRDVQATGYEMGMPMPAPVAGQWRVIPVDGGYVLDAMLPLTYFGIAPQAEAFQVDAAVIAAPYAGQKPAMVWLYSPQFAFSHNEWFAKATVADAR